MTEQELLSEGFEEVNESDITYGSLVEEGYEEATEEEFQDYLKTAKEEKSAAAQEQAKKIRATLLGSDSEQKEPVQKESIPLQTSAEIAASAGKEMFIPEDTTATAPASFDKEGNFIPPDVKQKEIQKSNYETWFGTGEEYVNPTAPDLNILAGFVNRNNELLSQTAKFASNVVKEDKVAANILGNVAEWAGENKMPYKETHTWEEVKKAFKKGGVFDIDSWQEVGNYIAEQGPQSFADMGMMVVSLPSYFAARDNEMAEARAKNDGRKEATNEDRALVAPFAAGSILLDKIGLKAMTTDAINMIGKDALTKSTKEVLQTIGKAVKSGAVKEGATEFAQEGIIESLGETIGTKKGAQIDLERGLAGMVAGAGMGGAISGVTATGAEVLTPSPDKQATQAIDEGSVIGPTTMQEGISRVPTVADASIVSMPQIVREVQTALPEATPEEINDIVQRVQEKISKKVPERAIEIQKLAEPEIGGSEDEAKEKVKQLLKKRVDDDAKFKDMSKEELQQYEEQFGPKEYRQEDWDNAVKSIEEEVDGTQFVPEWANHLITEDVKFRDIKRELENAQKGFPSDIAIRAIESLEEAKVEPIEEKQEVKKVEPQTIKHGKSTYSIDDKGEVLLRREDGTSNEVVGKYKDMLLKKYASEEDITNPSIIQKVSFQEKTLEDLLKINKPLGINSDGNIVAEMKSGSKVVFYPDDKTAIVRRSDNPLTENKIFKVVAPYEARPTETIKEKAKKEEQKLDEEMEAQKKPLAAKREVKKEPVILKDKEGEPITFYHGSKGLFKAFDKKEIGKATDSGMFGKGFYFSKSKDMASEYAKDGYLYEVNLEIKNPLVINSKKDIPKIDIPMETIEDMENADVKYSEAFTQQLKNKGYDGVIDNIDPNRVQVVAFEPEQIKILNQTVEEEMHSGPETLLSSKKTTPMPNNPPIFNKYNYPDRPADDKIMISNDLSPMPKKPTYPSDIKDLFINLVGDRFYTGNLAKWKLGHFQIGGGEIRLQSQEDIETMGHEAAHWLQYEKDKSGNYIKKFNKFLAKNRDAVSSYSYTSEADKKLSEGFAELMRAYFTQADFIINNTPLLLKELEFVLYSLGKKDYSTIKKIQARSHFYINQGAELLNRSAIAPHKNLKDRFYDYIKGAVDFNQNITTFVDIAHPAKVIAQDLGLEQDYKASNPYIQFRLATGHSESVVEAVTKYGTPLIDEKTGALKFSGEGLSKVFEPAMKGDHTKKSNNKILDDVFRYFQLLQAKYQIEEQGKSSVFTLSNINKELPLLEKREGFKEAHKKWMEFNERMLQFYVDMGHITEDQGKSFLDKNPFYVPTHRVMAEGQGASMAGGSGFKQRSKTGSERQLLPVDNIFTQIEKQIQGALISRAKKTLFQGIASKQDGGEWAARVPKTAKRYQALADQQAAHIAQVMIDEGMTINVNGDIVSADFENQPMIGDKEIIREKMEQKLKEDPNLAAFYTFGNEPFSLDGRVHSIIEGNEVSYFEINKGSEKGALLLNMLNGIDNTFQGNKALAMMHTAKNIMTRTIVTMPDFLLGNLFVDTTTAGVYTKAGFIPGVDSAKGAKAVTMENDDFKLFVLNGGAFGTRVEMATKESRKRQMMKLAIKEKSFARMLNQYDRTVSIGEMATRMGEYLNAREQGIDPMAASYMGTEISTDFNMHGSSTGFNALRSTVAFLPASINSLYKDYREYRATDTLDKFKHYKTLGLRGFSIITIPAIISMLLDDEEEDRTAAENARYSHYTVFGETYKHKTQFLSGLIFEKAPKLAAMAFVQDRGEKAWDIAKIGISSMLLPDATPSILNAPIEVGFNVDFKGSPIVPASLKELTGEAKYLQKKERTPLIYQEAAERAKAIGINVSPIIMQHYTESYLGYVSKWIEDGTNRLLWNEELHGEIPDKDFLNHLTHHFKYKDHGQSYWVDKYWKAREKALEIEAEIREAKRQVIIDRGRTLKQVLSNKERMAIAKTAEVLSSVEKQISKFRDLTTSIRYDKKLTSEEKDKKLLEINKTRGKILRKMFMDLDKRIKIYETK